MEIKLIAGDNDWSAEGTHVCDDHGFAIVLTAEKTITVSDEVYQRIMPIIESGRVFRGLNPDGSVPQPPAPEPQPEPQPEPEPQPVL